MNLSEASIQYITSIIENVIHIPITSMNSLDRQFDSKSIGGKTGITDGLFFINQSLILNIEIQRWLNICNLSDKLQKYISAMFNSSVNKGKKDGEMFKVIQIVFYESTIANNNQLIIKHSFHDYNNHSQIIPKMESYIIQVGLINKIYRTKGIENLNLIEAICFFMKNGSTDRYYDDIVYLKNKYKEVEFMLAGYEKYINQPAQYLAALQRDLQEEYAIKQAVDNANKTANKRLRNAEKKALAKGEKRGMTIGELIGEKRGEERGKVIGEANSKTLTFVYAIKALMQNTHCSLKYAMKILNIPESEHDKYIAILTK
jgi:hypothetical protein